MSSSESGEESFPSDPKFKSADWTILKKKSNNHEEKKSLNENIYKNDTTKQNKFDLEERCSKNKEEILIKKQPIVFSPRGNEGILVPPGVHVYYSNDGIDSDASLSDLHFHESTKQPPKTFSTNIVSSESLSNAISSEQQLCSIESQSENTDSVNTVLNLTSEKLRYSPLMLSPRNSSSSKSSLCPKPNFIIGGLTSPRANLSLHDGDNSELQVRLSNVRKSLEQSGTKEIISPAVEQDNSLISIISMDSTNHPESSERVTSPSIMSVSSAASSKKLEWDSGADVGYSGEKREILHHGHSLSTLERIAINNYASVIRSEPEGIGEAISTDKIKVWKKFLKSDKPLATKLQGRKEKESDLITAVLSKPKYLKENIQTTSSDDEIRNVKESPQRKLRKKSSKGIEKTAFKKNANKDKKNSNLIDSNNLPKYSILTSKSDSLINLVEKTCSDIDERIKFSTQNSKSLQDFNESYKEQNKKISTSSKKKYDRASSGLSLDKVNKKSKEIKSSAVSSTVSTNTSVTLLDNMSDEHTQAEMACQARLIQVPSSFNKGSSVLEISQWESILTKNLNTLPHEIDDKKTISSNNNSGGPAIATGSSLLSQSNILPISAINDELSSLSNKLKDHVRSLKKKGFVKNVEDYKKLNDYVYFIGIASANDEDVNVKQNVAKIILKMFRELQPANHSTSSVHLTDTSDTFDTFDSSTHYLSSTRGGERSSVTTESSELPMVGNAVNYDNEKPTKPYDEDEVNQNFVPYRPPSASRMYYMPVSLENQNSKQKVIEVGLNVYNEDRLDIDMNKLDENLKISCEKKQKKSAITKTEYKKTEDREKRSRKPSTIHYEEQRKASPPLRGLGDYLQHTSLDSNDNRGTKETRYLSDNVKTDNRRLHPSDQEKGFASTSNTDARSKFSSKNSKSSDSSLDSPSLDRRYQGVLNKVSSSQWRMRSLSNEENSERNKHEMWRRLYQDKQGAFHVANHPPDYQDSQPSESTSEPEMQRNANKNLRGTNDRPNLATSDDGNAPENIRHRPVFSSTASESAYETIRERHHNVDEALASSFEFYSTSPRDARLLGYVSNDESQQNEQSASISEAVEQRPPTSRSVHLGNEESNAETSSNIAQSSSRSNYFVKKTLHKRSKYVATPKKSCKDQSSSSSGNTNGEPAAQMKLKSTHRFRKPCPVSATTSCSSSMSSAKVSRLKPSKTAWQYKSPKSYQPGSTEILSPNASVVQVRRKKYVQRLSKYIQTLEKLERTLMPIGNDAGEYSESSIRRLETEGKSPSETSTNQSMRHILGKSGTATSSIISSIMSDSESHFPNKIDHKKSKTQRSEPSKSHKRLADDTSEGSWNFPSPRLTSTLRHSQSNSCDTTSSPLQKMEDEVQKLRELEKIANFHELMLSTKADPKIRQRPHHYLMKKVHREEPRGEEGPPKASANNPVVSKDKNSSKSRTKIVNTLDSNVSSLIDTSEKKSAASHSIGFVNLQKSENEDQSSVRISSIEDRTSEDEVSRQGDGSETVDHGRMILKPTINKPVLPNNPLHKPRNLPSQLASSTSVTPSVQNIGHQKSSSVQCSLLKSNSRSKIKLLKEFSQMFPSVQNIADACNTSTQTPLISNVSTQTGASLARNILNKTALNTKQKEKIDKVKKSLLDQIDQKNKRNSSTHSDEDSDDDDDNSNEGDNGDDDDNDGKDDFLLDHVPEKLMKESKTSTSEINSSDGSSSEFSTSSKNSRNSSSDRGKHDTNRDGKHGNLISSTTEKVSSINVRQGKVDDCYTSNKKQISSNNSRKEKTGYHTTSNREKVSSDKVAIEKTGYHTASNREKIPSNNEGKEKISQSVHFSSKAVKKPVSFDVIANGCNDKNTKSVPEEKLLKIINDKKDFPQKSLLKSSISTNKTKTISNSNKPNISSNNYNGNKVQTSVLSLREALKKAKPNYVKNAEMRREKIRMKQISRRDAQEHNHNVVSQIPPNLQTPSTLQRFLYKPESSPLFTYKSLREQNKRIYSLLPEAQKRGQTKKAVDRTNRLMKTMYSQKLRKNALAGKVSHGHKFVVSPL